MEELIYEKLIKDFEESLLTQLRGHNNEAGFLEMWVPDPDPRKSIINMVEAAEIYGLPDFVLTIGTDSIGEDVVAALGSDISDLAAVVSKKEGRQFKLQFSEIGTRV